MDRLQIKDVDVHLMKKGITGGRNDGKYFWQVRRKIPKRRSQKPSMHDCNVFRGTLLYDTPEHAKNGFKKFCTRAHLYEWGVFKSSGWMREGYTWRVRMKRKAITLAASHTYRHVSHTDELPEGYTFPFKHVCDEMAKVRDLIDQFAWEFRMQRDRELESQEKKRDERRVRRVLHFSELNDARKILEEANPPTKKQLRRRRRRARRSANKAYKRWNAKRNVREYPEFKVCRHHRILRRSHMAQHADSVRPWGPNGEEWIRGETLL